jgi:hypothetical protein
MTPAGKFLSLAPDREVASLVKVERPAKASSVQTA